ncbi:hypothetical protein D3C85_1137570 [compost metagenome]
MFGGVTRYLTADDISGNIHDHISLFSSIVLTKLTEVLNTQTGRYFITSGSGNEAVHIVEIDRRKLIKYQTAFQPSFLIHLLNQTVYIEGQYSSINLYFLGIIPHTDNFGI